jgi:hypothetical protein
MAEKNAADTLADGMPAVCAASWCLKEGIMQTKRRMIQLFVCFAIFGLGHWSGTPLVAQRILSGGELENGCQAYADKAVKIAKEWEERQCQKKLDYSPQLMDTDRAWHYNRCRNSVGTSIDANLKSMEDDLKKCPGTSGQTGGLGDAGNQGGWGGQRDKPDTSRDPLRDNSRRDRTRNDAGNSGGEVWDITVTNSADLTRSYHTCRIPSLNGMFTGQNMNPAGGPDFRGQMNGSVFEGLMTDNTGYRANFIGHGAGFGVIEGTGCDNRSRSFSFTMKRR